MKTGSHYLPHPSPRALPLLLRGGVSGDRQEQMAQPHQNCGHSPASRPPRGPHAEAQLEQSNPGDAIEPQAEEACLVGIYCSRETRACGTTASSLNLKGADVSR